MEEDLPPKTDPLRNDLVLTAQVSRYEYYRPSGGNLTYEESYPPCEEKEGPLCGCTHKVIARPEGVPTGTAQYVRVNCAVGEMRLDVELSQMDFIFHWGNTQDHAFFFFRKDSVRIEITLPGHGYVDCFFGKLYMGNDVDISRLMNGHSPSKIIKLNEIGPNQLWMHDCSWGREAMEILLNTPETQRWRDVFYTIRELRINSTHYMDQSVPVKDHHDRLLQDSSIMADVRNVTLFLKDFIEQIKGTEIFNCSVRIDTLVHGVKINEGNE